MPRGYESRGTTKGEAKEVTWDVPPDPSWHPQAIWLYESVHTSGQTQFWQNSDWAIFYSLCDDLSYIKNRGPRRSAEMIKGVYAALSSLGITEGDRRKARIELTAAERRAHLASVEAMQGYAEELGVDD